jgi:hypothetical protein
MIGNGPHSLAVANEDEPYRIAKLDLEDELHQWLLHEKVDHMANAVARPINTPITISTNHRQASCLLMGHSIGVKST